MIRIKKGDREFTASRMEIVRELIRRGLLGAEDLISVDDRPFQAAGELFELAELFHHGGGLSVDTDPWQHWSSTSLDSGEWETEAEGVLSSFLDVVTASSIPTLDALLEQQDERSVDSDPSGSAAPHGSPQAGESVADRHSDPDAFPPSLSAVAPVAVADEPDLETVDGALPSPLESPAESLDREVLAQEAGNQQEPLELPDEAQEPSFGGGRASPTGAISGSLAESEFPPELRAWLDTEGRLDPTISVGAQERPRSKGPTRPEGRFSALRVLSILAFGLLAVGGVRLWIVTGAQSDFPLESELGGGGAQAAADSAGAAESSVPPQAPAPNLQQRVHRLRNAVSQNIVPFSSAQMLEDSLFQECLNLGLQPTSVRVEALRVKGSLDKDSQRPVLANIRVEFKGVPGADEELRMLGFEDLLLTVWLVLGKYATLGKVAVGEARLVVREPTPWDESYEGRALAGLWTGSIPPEQLIMR